MNIEYKHSNEAGSNYHPFLTNLILANKIRKICEIGGGANPAIPLDFIQQHGIEYTILDISSVELAKAPDGYKKVVCDITGDDISQLKNNYDLVFSKMLAEHVKSGRRFHANVREILTSGGIAFHFFPTLYSPPFVWNRILPEYVSRKVLSFISRERDNSGNHGKFPAYYDMCRGPTRKNLTKLENMGYEIDSYIGFFGTGYYNKLPPLAALSSFVTKLLLKFPVPYLTSYSYLVLRKS